MESKIMSDNEEIIDVKISEEQSYIKPKQSANALFRFTTKLEYIESILENKAFMPRYNEESIDYLKLNQLEKIAFPMVCFCDISISKIRNHCEDYGKYGIGMNKKWGINKNIQPIHYINENSELIKDFSYLFNKLKEDENSDFDEYRNYLLSYLFFIKPLQGEMRKLGDYTKKNFHDENEWRYVPKMKDTELPPALIQKSHLNDKSYKSYSSGIKESNQLWLEFEYEDIKYIFGESEFDKQELMKFIDISLGIEKYDKYNWVSKIEVINLMEEDL